MATAYFKKDSTHVYFDHGMLVPHVIMPDRSQSKGEAEDGKLKVYDHSLAGSYKRTWKFKAVMKNDADTDHKFSDFISFMETTVVHAKYQFSYYDNDGNNYTVRAIGSPPYSYKTIRSDLWQVTIMLEEDYA